MSLNRLLLLIPLTALIIGSCQTGQQERSSPDYPNTPTVDTVDHYFGTTVQDPYRWMENLEDSNVQEWVSRQNKLTFHYLDQIPFRESIQSRLKEIWDYTKYSAPFRAGDHYFFFKNTGLQNQSVFYQLDSLGDDPEVFLNPNKMSDKGIVALKNVEADKKGKYMAYSLSRGGSDWEEIYVKNIRTHEQLNDTIKWVRYSSIAWYKDGFYYSRYPAPREQKKYSAKNKFHKIYYHRLGTPQSKDRVVYQDKKHPLRTFTAHTTEDEHYLMVYGAKSTSGNSLYVKNLQSPRDTLTPVVTHFQHDFGVVGTLHDKLLVKTNYQAPCYQLMLIDPQHPDTSHWEVLVDEREAVLQSARLAGGKLILEYMTDAHNRLWVYDEDGQQLREIDLPELGTVYELNTRKEDSTLFYSFASFTFPKRIYQYDVETAQNKLYREPEVEIHPDRYVTQQVFYRSQDGTKIPMFLTHKKGLDTTRPAPTLLYGYGGFNISILPNFSIARYILLENGGIYASANLRGGGEYGEKWHKAGMRLQKQNVFDDFIRAGEYLIEQGYTDSDHLGGYGRSNGGLLIGATMTQRPGLMEVAFPAVGVMDMLRYHKFTIGWAWAEEYGSSEDSVQFENLYSYSPYHNITDTCYPATMATTANRDDRVVPAHSYKFMARLQAHQTCAEPTLIRIETKAGHGAGTPTSKEIQQATDRWSFFFDNVNVTPQYQH